MCPGHKKLSDQLLNFLSFQFITPACECWSDSSCKELWFEPQTDGESVFAEYPGLLRQAKQSAARRALILPFSLSFFLSLIHRPLGKPEKFLCS